MSSTKLMLWTPTDWAEETRLRIEYINWKIQHNELPCLRITNITCDLNLLAIDPQRMMELFSQTGILIINNRENDEPIFKPLSFEDWRATVGVSKIKIKATNKQLNETPFMRAMILARRCE